MALQSPLEAEQRDRRPEQASQDKDLQKIGRDIAEDAAPNDRGVPIMDMLLDWEPV